MSSLIASVCFCGNVAFFLARCSCYLREDDYQIQLFSFPANTSTFFPPYINRRDGEADRRGPEPAGGALPE